MRPLSSFAIARAASRAQRIAWTLELTPADATDTTWHWRGATRAVTLNAELWPARLAAAPHWREHLDAAGDWPGGLAQAVATVRVIDHGSIAAPLREQLAQRPPLSLRATLRMVWLGDDLHAAGDDALTLLSGHVAGWRVEPGAIVLELQDELQTLAPRRIGRLLRAAMLGGGTSPMLGEPLPWVIGSHSDLDLPLLRGGAATRLRYPMTLISGRVPLASLEGFPAHGRVQIGAELIDYTAIDRTNLTLGTSWSGVTRGVLGSAAAPHTTGEAIRLVPPGGFQWFIADHPCGAVTIARADGLPIDGWSIETPQLGAHTATVLTRATWPLTPEGRFAQRISIACAGHLNPDGTLAENPADVLRLLLTHPRLGALPPSRLDTAAFELLRTRLATQGYRYTRRIAGRQSLGELLRTAARECGVWLGCGDPLRPFAWEPAPHAAEAQGLWTRAEALQPLAPAELLPPAVGRPPDAVELVGPPAAPGLAPVAWQFPPESLDGGTLPHRAGIDWLYLHTSAAAADLGELLWSHLGDTPFIVRQSFAPAAARLVAGETVRVDDAALDLVDALAWVTAAQLDPAQPARIALTLRGPWVNAYDWRADEDAPHLNHIRQLAFGARLQVVLGGRPVATLTRTGHLRLRGRLREHATFSAGPFGGPFTLSGGWLYFAVPTVEGHAAMLRIDGAGNAELHGSLREHAAAGLFTPPNAGHGTAPGRLWLSPDSRTPALELDAATARLLLRGTLIESVRL